MQSVLNALAFVKDELNEAVDVLVKQGALMDHNPTWLSTLYGRELCAQILMDAGCDQDLLGMRDFDDKDLQSRLQAYAKKTHQDRLARCLVHDVPNHVAAICNGSAFRQYGLVMEEWLQVASTHMCCHNRRTLQLAMHTTTSSIAPPLRISLSTRHCKPR